MKKIIALILSLVTICSFFCGCSGNGDYYERMTDRAVKDAKQMMGR